MLGRNPQWCHWPKACFDFLAGLHLAPRSISIRKTEWLSEKDFAVTLLSEQAQFTT